MTLANIDTLPPFLATRLSEGSSEQSGLPSWIVPVFILIILAIVYMLHINSQKKEAEAAVVEEENEGSNEVRETIATAIAVEEIDDASEEVETAVNEVPTPVVVVEEIDDVSEEVETAVNEVPTPVVVVEEVETPTPIEAEEPEEIIPDNLRKIEGIGPKIAGILNDDGIFTFTQLAAATVPHLEKVVRVDAGIRIAYPDTWPEQAQFAADGKWDELDALQDSLKGGRRV